ncbi:MAG: TraR/DksA C4-type zinc finger protein [Anaerolineae bacterium]
MELTAQQRSDIEKLERERQALLTDLANFQIELRNMAEPSADEADLDTYEREKIWALARSLEERLRSIERAIQSAQSGTYGLCQNCGERIDPARLEILPDAIYCLRCQREFERRNRRWR